MIAAAPAATPAPIAIVDPETPVDAAPAAIAVVVTAVFELPADAPPGVVVVAADEATLVTGGGGAAAVGGAGVATDAGAGAISGSGTGAGGGITPGAAGGTDIDAMLLNAFAGMSPKVTLAGNVVAELVKPVLPAL